MESQGVNLVDAEQGGSQTESGAEFVQVGISFEHLEICVAWREVNKKCFDINNPNFYSGLSRYQKIRF